MNFILKLVMSSAYFLPSTATFTPYDSKESCEFALKEAKKIWATVNDQSECIDIERQRKIESLQKQIKDLK